MYYEYSCSDLTEVYKSILKTEGINEHKKMKKCFKIIDGLSGISIEKSLPAIESCVITYDRNDMKDYTIPYEEFKEENTNNNKRYALKTMLNHIAKTNVIKFPVINNLPLVCSVSSEVCKIRYRSAIKKAIPKIIDDFIYKYEDFINEQENVDIFLALENKKGLLKFRWIYNIDNMKMEQFGGFNNYLKIKIYCSLLNISFYVSKSLITNYDEKLRQKIDRRKNIIDKMSKKYGTWGYYGRPSNYIFIGKLAVKMIIGWDWISFFKYLKKIKMSASLFIQQINRDYNLAKYIEKNGRNVNIESYGQAIFPDERIIGYSNKNQLSLYAHSPILTPKGSPDLTRKNNAADARE